MGIVNKLIHLIICFLFKFIYFVNYKAIIGTLDKIMWYSAYGGNIDFKMFNSINILNFFIINTISLRDGLLIEH